MPDLRSAISKPTVPAVQVAGVGISHPERLIAEAPGHTKLDVVRYHERLGHWLVPQLAPRPIAQVPSSRDDAFDSDASRWETMQERAQDAGERALPPFIRVSDVADVVRVVQNGTYEFHTWGASFPRLERPDRMTLDLDPDTDLSWAAVQDAANRVRGLFASLDLAAFFKTTGGRGLHCVVPLTRRHTWGETLSFARAIALHLARHAPALFTAAANAGTGCVHVDCQRNAPGASAVAAYSLRARAGLPVSMPIAWTDLADGDVRGRHFNIDNVEASVAARPADPWALYDQSRRTISASMRRALSA